LDKSNIVERVRESAGKYRGNNQCGTP